MIDILLPTRLTDKHKAIILAYLHRGHEFRRTEWRRVIEAFDTLRNAAILTSQGIFPFPVVYRQQIEDRFADSYIDALYETAQPQSEGAAQWAVVARQILPTLQDAGLFAHDVPATNLLLAYCLYWWRSFTHGYALEMEIQRDLQRSGIRFQAHDLRRRTERLSPYDIAVLGFKGDIKTSVYFLQAIRSRDITHDFVITQVQGPKRLRTLVVFMQAHMWQEIDGDTLLVLLENVADTLPQAAMIKHRGLELTVIDYDAWKERVRLRQVSEGEQ